MPRVYVCINPIQLLFVLQHESEYKSILSATKSGASEKRLAAQFIPRFFKYFPHMAEQAIDAQMDLCEDDDVSVSLYIGLFYI